VAFDYSGIVGTASDLLNKFGKTTAIVRVKGAATSNPVDGCISYGPSTDTPINAVQVEHNIFYTPDALIEDGDIFYVLDGEASLEDELVINDTVHNIVQVWPTNPGGTSIVWRVQTRGGVVDASAGTPGTAPTDAFDYSGIAATASELLGEFGQSATLLAVGSTTSNPVAGTVSFDSANATDTNAVQVKHNERFMPGALIEDGDRFWYLSVIAGIGDELAVGAETYKIVKVWPTKPGDTSIVSRIQTRGGMAGIFPDHTLYSVDMQPLRFVDGEIIETVD